MAGLTVSVNQCVAVWRRGQIEAIFFKILIMPIVSAETDRLEELFIAAAEIGDPGQRAAWLDEACAGDAALRGQVEKLLQEITTSADFLESPPPGLDQVVAEQATLQPGDHVGRYEIVECIGDGGFGQVYRAIQPKPVRREVALKTIRPGMDSDQVLARFDTERQALALMKHPNIAIVHDADTTDDGVPFFVMELVEGLPITDYCNEKSLDVAARLRLFVDVCRAVEHAHEQGVIHRDIKPSNVMVTNGAPGSEGGLIKVIDFGIATAMDFSSGEMSREAREFVGTPEYVCPEQFLTGEIDARADVFSLGALLYRLLAGAGQYPADEVATANSSYSVEAWRKLVCVVLPVAPSKRVDGIGLNDELDAIVMTALAKDPEQRYTSPRQMADDIERYLRSEPVSVYALSAVGRFKKFARRNRIAVSAAAIVFVAVIVGVIIAIEGQTNVPTPDEMTSQLSDDASDTLAQALKLRESGKPDEAVKLLRDALKAFDEKDASMGSGAQSVRQALLLLLQETDRDADTAAMAMEMIAKAPPDERRRVVRPGSALNRAVTLVLKNGDGVEAERIFREWLTEVESDAASLPQLSVQLRAFVGMSLVKQRRLHAGETMLLACVDELREDDDPNFLVARMLGRFLVSLYEQTNRPQQASVWKKRLKKLDKLWRQPDRK